MRRSKTAFGRGVKYWNRYGARARKVSRMEDWMLRQIHRLNIEREIEEAQKRKRRVA